MKPKRKRTLRFAGLHPRTLRAYRAALDRFLRFTRKSKVRLSSPRKLDRELAEFIEVSYQEGEPISYAGHLLSAVKRFHPEVRLKLPVSSQLFRNWQRCYVPERAIPAAWELVEALMGVAFEKRQPLFALLLALGFNCLLRTSEMLAITHAHLLFHPRGRSLSVVLPGSKTSQGNPQVILVTDNQLIRLASQLVQPGAEALLWTKGPHQFRKFFAHCLRQLNFSGDSYTPYALRRGGATWHFQTFLSMDLTVARGRWSCMKTARTYVDEGTAQLAHIHWSGRQRLAIAHWRRQCRQFRLRQRR